MNVIDKLKEKGFDTAPEDFYAWIDLWKSWYDGNVKNFHNFTVFNGQSHVKCHRYTMGMAKKVAEDWANLLMNEKVSITLEGEKEQTFFDDVCRANNFEVKANEMQEMKAGLGTAAYVLHVDGAQVRQDTGELVDGSKASIKIDYVTAPNIFPLTWDNCGAKECAFSSSTVVGGEKYIYLQIHRIGDDGNYVIENSIYRNTHGEMTEVSLSAVNGFENIPAVVHTNSPKPQFLLDRLNIANNVDNTLPMGIPAFANAIDQLKGVDVAYDSYVNEFVLGKKRVMVKPGAVKDIDGNPLFDPNELVFYVLPEDVGDGSVIDPIDMTLRTTEHRTGIQDMLSALSSKCGFGENHYEFGNNNLTTATQVISTHSSMFQTIKKHEDILKPLLKELCRIILQLGNTYMNAGLNEDVKISIDFDDSIIENKEEKENKVYRMLDSGLMTAAEARSILMNEDFETARAALPKMEDMVTGGQDEVE